MPTPMHTLHKNESIKIKRIYEKPTADDGLRVLVDRLWPRGMSKEKARIDLWLKEIAPSDELRRQFHHQPERWEEFRREYLHELDRKHDVAGDILGNSKERAITLLYGAKDSQFNNAVVLKEFLEARARGGNK